MDKELLDALRQMMREELDTRDRKLDEKFDIRDQHLAAMMDEKLDVRDQHLAAMMDEKLEPLKEDIRHMRVLIEAHDEKFQLIHEAQAETAAKFGQLDRMEKTLNETKSEVEVIRDVVRFHSTDIDTLKKAL